MTVREMQEGFEIELGQIDENLQKRLVSSDIEYYLTSAQEETMSRRFGGNNIYKDGFEESVKRIEDLRELNTFVTNLAATTNISNISNSVYFDSLPSDYAFYVKSFSNVTRDDTSPTTFNTANKLIKSEESNKFTITPFNSPIMREPVAILLENKGVLVLHDKNTTIDSLDVQYLRNPKKLTSRTLVAPYPDTEYTNTSELPQYMHQEIVSTAVRIAAGIFKPEAYQIKSDTENKVE